MIASDVSLTNCKGPDLYLSVNEEEVKEGKGSMMSRGSGNATFT